MKLTVDQLREVILAKKYRWNDTEKNSLNIIGIRSEASVSNSFDDWLAVAFKDSAGNWTLKTWPITTDPGKSWLLAPMNKDGCAVMVPGQYLAVYAVGIHGRSKPASRRYEALEQVGKIAYVRDNTRDAVINRDLYKDQAKVFWAILKTNIHRASRWAITRAVEQYSAGCQVFQDPAHFEEFMAICRSFRARLSNRFDYTLLEEHDLTAPVDLVKLAGTITGKNGSSSL